MAHDVFVSYSVKDKATADAICATLEANGIRVWIAPRDVMPGSDWGESIIEAIEQSKVMILVFSANSNSSPQIEHSRRFENSQPAAIMSALVSGRGGEGKVTYFKIDSREENSPFRLPFPWECPCPCFVMSCPVLSCPVCV